MLTADMSSRVRRATLSEHSYFMVGPRITDHGPRLVSSAYYLVRTPASSNSSFEGCQIS